MARPFLKYAASHHGLPALCASKYPIAYLPHHLSIFLTHIAHWFYTLTMDPCSEPKKAQRFVGARRALLILTAVNLFNYLDRYVVSSLFESIKKDLGLSDMALGMLLPGFIIVYMLASPIFGYLGDRGNRVRYLAIGVALWSLATAAGALAWGFFSLFVARALVGVGEAAYGTIAPAMLGDFFPKKLRGRIFAIFFMAIPVGSALGYILGGLADKTWGWRAAFLIAGLPGLLLAALCLLIRDPPRGAKDHMDPKTKPTDTPSISALSLWATYAKLLRLRTYRLSILGYGAYTFALGGLASWMPAFLERVRGLSHTDATVQFGAVIVITGFMGTALGGWLGDYLLRKADGAYLWVSGISAFIAVPAAWVAITSSHYHTFMVAMIIAELALFVSTGPINSAIINAVPPHERASAVALGILIMHLLGDVPSPLLIGFISDATGSLGTGLLLVPIAILVAGSIWTWAAVRHP